jgi:hypothetical protein
MCPLLSEQFFWSKNLKYHTGQPYFDINKDSSVLFKKALEYDKDKQKVYLTEASRSMKRSDTPSRILTILQK